jgi:hypothetical protein
MSLEALVAYPFCILLITRDNFVPSQFWTLPIIQNKQTNSVALSPQANYVFKR